MMRNGRAVPAATAVLALALAAGASTGPPADATTALAGLQRWLDGTHDLSCRFEQTLVSGALGEGVSEQGRLYLERPGKMRWEYTRPEAKVAVVNAGQTLLYLPEDHQLIRGDPQWSDSPLLALLSGGTPVRELFEVSTADPEPGGGGYRLRLVPREASEGFEEVTLTLDPPAYSISAVEVLDAAGNRMRYEFRSLRRNRGVAEDLFVIVPPAGTEIVNPP